MTFLIGALRDPPGIEITEPTVAELRSLLVNMRSVAGNSTVVRIYQCGQLGGAPTACLSDATSGSLGDAVTLNGLRSKLYAWPQYFEGNSRDLESLATCLWGLLSDKIRAHAFSYRLKSYREFNNDDKDFIARAFSRQDDYA